MMQNNFDNFKELNLKRQELARDYHKACKRPKMTKLNIHEFLKWEIKRQMYVKYYTQVIKQLLGIPGNFPLEEVYMN